MKTAICNGVTIKYQTVGDGNDVVLIHGLAANHAFWRLNILMELAKRYRVTVYDLRGHGYSDMPPSGYTSGDMAEDLAALLETLGSKKAHLVGHSVGGVIALHAAVLYPERVASLMIADSRVRALQPTNYAREWSNWDTAGKKLADIGLCVPEAEAEAGLWILERLAMPQWQAMRDTLKETSLFAPFGGWNGGQKSAERWLELMHSTSAREDIGALAGLTTDRLTTIRQPVLMMYGENSPTMPSMRGLKKCIPHAKTEVVPGAGHFYPLSRPELFVRSLGRFLNEMEEVQAC